MRTPILVAALAGAVVAAMTVFACGGGSDSGTAGAKLPEGVRSTEVEHEACSEGGHRVEALDANGDGKPDLKKVYDGAREVCRISDLNHDGTPDLYEYYDKSGQLRRREADYDGSGVVDSIDYYENGKLVRRDLDLTGQHKIDTWDFFDPGTGKLARRERDTTGDGRVDQWWTYQGDKVTIAFDKNNDGKPDPNDTMELAATSMTATSSGAGVGGSQAKSGGDGGNATLQSTASSMGTGNVDAGFTNTPTSPDASILQTPTTGDAGPKPKGGKKK
jgi:hypothetical protein